MRSPNISGDWRLYEVENRAADPEGTVEHAMARIASWRGKVVIDVGAGTGYHIERFHHDAAHVIAVEPDPELRIEVMQRMAERNLARTSVIGASAAAIPLRDDVVDIAHARFAYFFGPGCEPGLAELKRILKPGGTAFIIDNDLRSGTFAAWVRSAYPTERFDPDAIERFWREQGFTIERLESCWRFENRDDLERVVHLEFPEEHAARFVAEHEGLDIDYNLLLIHKTFPG
jgi:ubiquinone/menaquinone biosynthesis C-methylase UbiE